MFKQDYLNHISLPAKLYDKIESDVADLFMDLNIREYPVDPMQIALDLGYDLVPFTQMPKEVKREGSVAMILNERNSSFIIAPTV